MALIKNLTGQFARLKVIGIGGGGNARLTNGFPGLANTGGGGGGTNYSSIGGQGGSGVVIIRWVGA